MAKLIPELICSNFATSLRFYTELLGFALVYARHDERFAMLDRDGARIMIEQPTGRSFLTGELQRPYGRGVNFEIDVPDAETLHRACVTGGAAIHLPLEEKWYRCGDLLAGVRQFIVQDPDGYLLRFSTGIGTKPAPGRG